MSTYYFDHNGTTESIETEETATSIVAELIEARKVELDAVDSVEASTGADTVTAATEEQPQTEAAE